MRWRGPATWALAMQLTNIARDVGEDARAGRLYLPLDWLDEAGIDPEAFLADPLPRTELHRRMVRRLLHAGGPIFIAASRGGRSRRCPLACRPGIFAARHIYAGDRRRGGAAGL